MSAGPVLVLYGGIGILSQRNLASAVGQRNAGAVVIENSPRSAASVITLTFILALSVNTTTDLFSFMRRLTATIKSEGQGSLNAYRPVYPN